MFHLYRHWLRPIRTYQSRFCLALTTLFTGALFAAMLLFAALTATQSRPIVYQLAPEPVPMVQMRTYNCDNINDIPTYWYLNADHRYALEQLQYACDQERNAIMLTHIWYHNPSTGEVLGD